MKCVVVGPGALGSLLASRLCACSHEVSLLDHRPDRAAHLSKNGVLIFDGSAVVRVRIRTTCDASSLNPADFVFVCAKAYDTGDAVSGAVGAMVPSTAVVTMQNGLGNVEVIRSIVPGARIVCAATGQGAMRDAAGIVHAKGDGGTSVASASDAAKRNCSDAAVMDLLSTAGMSVRRVSDWETVVWSKVVVNAAINPVSAIWGVCNGDVYLREDLRETAVDAVCEAGAVATGKGIRLLYDDPVVAMREACERTAGNISSMLQDIRNGKRTEIDQINGAIIREAGACGVSVPTNRMLFARVSCGMK